MKIALIENGMVTNIIVGDIANYPNGVDITNVSPSPNIDWSYNGSVFTAPAAPPPITTSQAQRAFVLGRMTATEVHLWHRAMSRATATNTPVVADRNALYAWVRWESMGNDVDMSGTDMQSLKGVWVALGMTQARADEILAPIAQ